MTRIAIKRVYEPATDTDGLRVLVDKLWPRGIRKEALHYDLWAKEIAPSAPLRRWFHADPQGRWEEFRRRYLHELAASPAVRAFAARIEKEPRATLLYASKNAEENHARVLPGVSRTGVGMTYPLQENADGVFANRILRPEPEMQAMFSEIGLRTCRRGAFPLPAGGRGKPAGKKSPGNGELFYLTRNRIYSELRVK